MSRIFDAVGVIFLLSACSLAQADELLYQWEGDVFPNDPSAGWLVFDPCEDACSEAIEEGHLVFRWRDGANSVNYSFWISKPPDDPPPTPTLWVEWRFRSDHVLATSVRCDASFVVRYNMLQDLIDMHGDTVVSFDGGSFVLGLDVGAFHTYRFESLDGFNYQFSVDGLVFFVGSNSTGLGGGLLQMFGKGTCLGDQTNEWDYVRFGTISEGESIASTDPPQGTINANAFPNLDRFAITFDRPGYVYLDDVTVSVTGGDLPVVTQTWRRENDGPETLEIVLDRPLAVGETTTFTLDTGGDPQEINYTYLSFGACCFDDGTCADTTEESACGQQGGAFRPGASCELTRGCCIGDGTCLDLSPVCCELSNGTPLAVGSFCEGDLDSDNIDAECGDNCPNDPFKTEPGLCGCGIPDVDSDGDTVPDCNDQCPGRDDTRDFDNNGVPDCIEFFPIPTVSTWGLVVLTLLLGIASKLAFGWRRVDTSYSARR
jgi:hypothetical protein